MTRIKEKIEILTADMEYSADDFCKALLGFHAFTGCDTVSSFAAKGKSKAFKVLLSHPNHVSAFKSLGESLTIVEGVLVQLQEFVCAMYGGGSKDVNEIRYRIYRSKRCKISCEDLPPCHSALVEHCKRANYQARIWRLALEAEPEDLSPIGHGWERSGEEDGEQFITIKWMSCGSAPDEVINHNYFFNICFS